MELHKEEGTEGIEGDKNIGGNKEDDNNNKFLTNDKNKRTTDGKEGNKKMNRQSSQRCIFK